MSSAATPTSIAPASTLFAYAQQEKAPRRIGVFFTSIAVQMAAIAIAIFVSLTAPTILEQQRHFYTVTPLVMPSVAPAASRPVPAIPVAVLPAVSRSLTLDTPRQQVRVAPVPPAPPILPPVFQPKASLPELPKPAPVAPPVPRKVAATAFSDHPPIPPPLPAARPVQSIAFAVSEKATPAATPQSKVVAVLQGFEQPTPSPRQPENHNAAVGLAGFGMTQPPSSPRNRSNTVTGQRLSPVVVETTPKPLYTDEARRLHIEGEVLLQVVFQSSGKVHVLSVIKGLGYGLDGAAIRAAERIHFKPAQSAGQSVDSDAVVHIVFALS
jgi:TonB family protein